MLCRHTLCLWKMEEQRTNVILKKNEPLKYSLHPLTIYGVKEHFSLF